MAGDDYRQASLEIWDEMAAGWEGHRARVWDASRAVSEWLVDALDPQPGETVLELAAGIGDTGFAAARRLGAEGRLITTDFSEAMVDGARRRAREVVEIRAFGVQGFEQTQAEPPDPLAPGIFAMASEGGRVSCWSPPDSSHRGARSAATGFRAGA